MIDSGIFVELNGTNSSFPSMLLQNKLSCFVNSIAASSAETKVNDAWGNPTYNNKY